MVTGITKHTDWRSQPTIVVDVSPTPWAVMGLDSQGWAIDSVKTWLDTVWYRRLCGAPRCQGLESQGRILPWSRWVTGAERFSSDTKDVDITGASSYATMDRVQFYADFGRESFWLLTGAG